MNPIIALIPARAGSKRVPGKNIRRLGDHPLIAYTISAALRSGVFFDSSSPPNAGKPRPSPVTTVPRWHCRVPQSLQPTFRRTLHRWVHDILRRPADEGDPSRYFSILRSASSFREAMTIRKAWAQFLENPDAELLRDTGLC
jgi:CMP-N,N'-diacetyllegionaminic acid synthase